MRMAAAVRWLLLPVLLLAASMPTVIYADDPGPTESECRPYIEKALKQQHETPETTGSTGSGEDTASLEVDENEQLILTPEDSTEPGIEESSLEESIAAEDQKEETETQEEGTESREGEQISAEPTESEGAIEGSEEDTKEEDKESEEENQGEENKEEVSQETEESEDQQEQSSEVEREDSGEISEEGQDEIEKTEEKEESDDVTKEESGEETKEESGEDDKEESGEETKEVSGEDDKEESGEETKEESGEDDKEESDAESEEIPKEGGESGEEGEETASLEEKESTEATEETSAEDKTEGEESIEATDESLEEQKDQTEESKEDVSEEEKKDESGEDQEETVGEEKKDDEESLEEKEIDETNENTESVEEIAQEGESSETKEDETASDEEKTDIESEEGKEEAESVEENAEEAEDTTEVSQEKESLENKEESKEDQEEKSGEQEESEEKDDVKSEEETTEKSQEETKDESEEDSKEQGTEEKEVSDEAKDEDKEIDSEEVTAESVKLSEASPASEEEAAPEAESQEQGDEESAEKTEGEPESKEESGESPEEEDLTLDFEIPENLRPRGHIGEILQLTPESAERELLLGKTIQSTLKELKRVYDSAIKPLELLYKYRDLSNRHFGDPEIFSKPLILFMGPWSGGKSTIINYLLDNEYKQTSLRTGAEPSPAYFNILMYGEDTEILDGTQLAADWTFSGLQKFGQGLLDRLRGLRLPSPLLEKVNIVEIPGILEIRKQIERVFPFNDACQWFIDRADIIFLVYDPSKLDVGPETEAILDQLKGREYQTRIILNKADQVKPEELMRVQGTLIWNISPLMSSPEPPVMYSTSLWSMPYEIGAPIRLLSAQERAFLRDFRQAIDRRVENKISSARRFAVRVRNHAKMVDCYLTTYYNHMSFFGNKKRVADGIVERPQDYHIYEGLSTLTNISRYDLPDPDVYRDFFRLNPLYEFQQLSATCTYFRGCPINRLDVAIAYDLPELVGKYKKSVEHVLAEAKKSQS